MANSTLFDDLEPGFNRILAVIGRLDAANQRFADSAIVQNNRVVASMQTIISQAQTLRNQVQGLGRTNSGNGSNNALTALANQTAQLTRQQQAYQAVLQRNQQFIDLNTASVNALRQRINDLRTEYNNLDRANAQSAQRMDEINREVAQASQHYNLLNRTINEATRATRNANNSYDALDQTTRRLRAQLRAMPDAFSQVTGQINQNNQAAVRLQRQIEQNERVLRNADTQMGVHGRNVGNYGSALKDIVGDLVGFTTVAGGIGAAFAAIKSGIEIIAEMEQLSAGLRAVSKDTADFERSEQFLMKTADQVGVKYTSLIKSYKLLKAATKDTSLEGKTTEQIFKAIANAGAKLQLSNEEVEGSLYAIGQMVSKGKVSMEELRQQLGERLPGAFKIMADALGISTAQLDKMVSSGDLLATDILPKFAKQLDKVYGGDAEERVNTMTAGWNRMVNEVQQLLAAFNENKAVSTFFGSILTGIASVLRNMKTLVTSNEWGSFMGLFTGNAAAAMAQAQTIEAGKDVAAKADAEYRAKSAPDRQKMIDDQQKKVDELKRKSDALAARPYNEDTIEEEKRAEAQVKREQKRLDYLKKADEEERKADAETDKRRKKEKADADAAKAESDRKKQEAAANKAQAEADRKMNDELSKSKAKADDGLTELTDKRQSGIVSEQEFIEQRLAITLSGLREREAILTKYGKKETDDYINVQKEKKKADSDYKKDQLQLDLKTNKSTTANQLADLDNNRNANDLTDLQYIDERHKIIVAGIERDQKTLVDAGMKESELYKQTETDILSEQGDYWNKRYAAEKAGWKLVLQATKAALDDIDKQTADEYQNALTRIEKAYNKLRNEVEDKRAKGSLSDYDADAQLHLINIEELKDQSYLLKEANDRAKQLTHEYVQDRITELEKVANNEELSERERSAARTEILKFQDLENKQLADNKIVYDKKAGENADSIDEESLKRKRKLVDDQKKLQEEALKLVTKSVDGGFETNGFEDAAKGIMSVYDKIHNHRETLKAREQMTDAERKDAQLKDLQDIAEATAAIGSGIVSTLYNMEKQKTQQRLAEVDKREAYELSTVGDSESAKAAVQEKYAAQRKALQHQEDVATRNKALFEILVNTAVAVTKALPNVALSVLIGGLGLLEYGLTAAQPYPQYFTGKNVAGLTNDNYAGPALAGDRFGRELWFHDDTVDLIKKPTLINVGPKDVILPNRLTERLLNDQHAWEANDIITRTKSHQRNAGQMSVQRDDYQARLIGKAMGGQQASASAIGKAVSIEMAKLPIEHNTWDETGYHRHSRQLDTLTVNAQKKRRHP